ncbi:GlcNAc-transferase family protein [Pantoea sp. BAV 3049]|uniref:GlcNAc-transferase family protein n=1 Tax=Pantoea sp. BAV 3049 TaxID=2654188 RepID=UPI00131C0C99|nr:GlcNAc-transferase family protein [Pantoea sp. BAV 3049]
MELKPEIFVSIASYRDAELIPTLTDMIKNASDLHSLNIAVCWQDEGDITPFLNEGMELSEQTKSGDHDLFVFNYQGARIQFLSVHYFLSEGACWARHLCENLYNNEDYFLQIDSHCRFVKNWDKEMISMLAELQKQSSHPVISSYPPGYKPGDESSKNTYVSRLVFRGFSSDRVLQLTSVDFKNDEPLRGTYLAGGFIFAKGSFVIDIPNDPQIFFEGEEIAMAARAFTHGYDVWHPHKILLWHFYGRKDHTKVWSDHNGEAKKAGSIDKAWWDRDSASKKRVRTLLGYEKDGPDIDPRYALGNKRTLTEFEETIGVDFTLCSVLPEVVENGRCSYFTDNHLQDWRKRVINTNKKTLTIPKSELDCQLNNISRLHIGVYSINNDLLDKKVLSAEEIDKSINKENVEELKFELDFTTLPSQKPSVIRVSPYIHNEGWGKIVERAW